MSPTEDLALEKTKLENYAANYITSDDSSQQRLMRQLEMRVFGQFLRGGNALELGCEIGYMSELISPRVDHLDIVDASEAFLAHTRSRQLPNADFHCALFEEFQSERRYDHVIASHILEHLIDVPAVLQRVRMQMNGQGLLYVAVPNARALSRQLARHMGLVSSLYDLTPNDLRGGHRRVYDRVTLDRDLRAGGFEVIAQGGIFFKYLADFQMDKMIDSGILGPAQLEGLFHLGNEYPDMCADVFAIARPLAA